MALFPRALHAAKLDQCLSSRFIRRHPRRDIPFDRKVQVELQFIIKRFRLSAEKKKSETVQPFPDHDCTAAVSTSPMAADSLSQFFSSVSSCLRPVAVKR